MLQDVLTYAGIAVFACSGALVGIRKDFDLFGILSMGAATGVGGGVICDLLLDITPPSSVQNWPNLTIALISGLLTFFFHPAFKKLFPAIMVLDAIGMGVFAVSGALLALEHDASAMAAVLIGITMAVGGGVLRDVLAREVPMLLRPTDLYAVPAMCGAIAVVIVDGLGWPQWTGLVSGAAAATLLRIASLQFKWHLPMAPQRRS
ncbi:trimeric intracellular cation channel family protein [Nocardia sp. 348MFTsu5.1]|uniref:trimeric intracellular cation channel family protein n=1 Tax=Nocardia sp. 348MFTsu5.1 TaxID=1172185 RepID=UPI0003622EFE|nr:trimeric intracellular cation channel family protein [Nocardia sp. 348MFTsu5.1]